MTVNWIQISMAVIYILILVCVGLSMTKKVKTSSDYWIGGRQIGPFVTAISYSAAYYSTVAVVGGPPLYYLYGLGYSAIESFLNIFLTGWVIFVLFAPKMRAISERIDAMSLSGFLAVRYRSNKIRLYCALIIATMMIPYAMSCVKGIADALNVIAGINYQTGVIIIIAVSFAYLVTSGYWGAATVDLIQGLTITIALIVTAGAVLIHTKGISPIVEYIVKEQPVRATLTGGLSWGTMFSYAGVWAFIAFGQPQLTSKFMGLKDGRTVGAVIRVSTAWQIVYFITTAIIGMGALYLYKGVKFDNIDLIVPSTATKFGGTTVSGIFLCGALAAGFSTVAALVLTSSAAVAKDIYEDYRSVITKKTADPAKSVQLSRIITGIVLIIICVGSLHPLDFVWALSTMSAGVMGAAFTAPVILGLYWKRATTQGCVTAIIGRSILSIIWYLAGLSHIIHSFVPGTIASFILMFVVSLLTKPMPEEHVEVFFNPACSQDKIHAAIASAKQA
jgi:Na+/proline symporter